MGWPDLELERPLAGGTRTEVWSGHLEGGTRRIVARRSLRTERSRLWEWSLLQHLASHHIGVPTLIASAGGGFDVDGWHVYPFVDGMRPEPGDPRVLETIARVHAVTTRVASASW